MSSFIRLNNCNNLRVTIKFDPRASKVLVSLPEEVRVERNVIDGDTLTLTSTGGKFDVWDDSSRVTQVNDASHGGIVNAPINGSVNINSSAQNMHSAMSEGTPGVVKVYDDGTTVKTTHEGEVVRVNLSRGEQPEMLPHLNITAPPGTLVEVDNTQLVY